MILIVELPEQNELVLAVIKKIMPYGAFCVLPEYNNVEAFLHVSEVAPRWIKNIHEFISEGQRHVVKVHHVDKEKNQVDISIKRVSEQEKKQKLEMVQSEKRGRKLLEIALKESDVKLEFDPVKDIIEAEYGLIFDCFREASEKGEEALAELKLPKPLKAKIIELAKKNIKKPVMTVNAVVSLICYAADGISVIKKVLAAEGVEVTYLGAPRYQLSLTAGDYKTAEKRLAAVLRDMEKTAVKNGCDFSVKRED